MAEIPQSVIDQFFADSGVNNLVIQDFGYTSTLGSHGDFHKYNGKELAVYRLAVLLSIHTGTYPNDPELGVNLIDYIYKPFTDSVLDAITNELKSKIEKYEKDFFLISITPLEDEVNKTVYFNLQLKYIPTDEDVSLDFDFISDIEALMIRSR